MIHKNFMTLSSLPTTLTKLTLKNFHATVTDAQFNQIVAKELPSTLTHLATGQLFNEPVDNFHPHSLTSQLGIFSTNQ
jgi:hypothetical protein